MLKNRAPAVTAGHGGQLVLIGGKFLTSAAYFAALPFLTLYLTTEIGAGLTTAGALVGVVALVSSTGSWVTGRLIDRGSAVRWMELGLLGYAAVYIGLAFTRSITAIALLLVGMGIARAAIEPASKRLMSAAAGADDQARIFRARYVIISMGAIVGPLVGASLYSRGATAFFLFPAVLLIAYVFTVHTLAHRLMIYDFQAASPSPEASARRRLHRDHSLWLVIGAGLTFFIVFSQFESMLPLLLHEADPHGAVQLFTVALVADAVLAVLLQPVIMRMSNRCSSRRVALGGAVSLMASFCCFASLGVSLGMLVPGVLFFAVAEGILFPLPDIYIHQIAPHGAKASYYGAAEIRYLGFSLGPITGAAALDLGHVPFVIASVGASLLCLVFFELAADTANRIPNTDQHSA